jgi:thioesterase domain-containing protein
VLIAGEAGLADPFQPLAQLLGDQQPLFGLHAFGAEDDRDVTSISIEDLAAYYLPQLNAVDADGPIVLGGYGIGALIAFELALRLHRTGRRVPLLVSLDGFAPGHPQRLPFYERFEMHVRELIQRGPRARLEYAQQRIERLRRRLSGRLNDHTWQPLQSYPAAIEQRLRAVDAGLQHAREHYVPSERAASDLLLLRASVTLDSPGCRIEPLYGWRNHVDGRIEAICLPGSHVQVLRASNRVLMADILSRRLAELNERARRAGRA